MGRDGDQVLRLRQRRPPGSLHHRHALGHVRGDRRRTRRSRSPTIQWPDDDSSGRRPTTSSATRSSTTSAAASSRRSPIALGVENYWPWGPSVGRPERRRLAGHLHRLQHELPVPLRHQLAAAEQPAARSSCDAEFLLGIEPRRGGRTHTTVVRPRLRGEDMATEPLPGAHRHGHA